MINITTALAADKLLFNSHTHKTAFLKAIPEFLKKGQDFIPIGIAGKIRRKSRVLLSRHLISTGYLRQMHQ